MRAIRFRTPGRGAEVCDVDVPEPGPGQVLVKLTAAGLCHSDLSVMHDPSWHSRLPLPITLGHEGVGVVETVGEGVTGVAVGDDVAVYLIWACGRCPSCASGRENYCVRVGASGRIGPGLGADGTLADYLLVEDARYLVPLRGLDPVSAVPLTDAALTPYHAIKQVLPQLSPGSTAVVVGVGGLGHMAVQLLRAITAARVVALDVDEERLALANELGAHDVVVSDDQAARTIRRLTDGLGATVILDFVGTDATLASAAAMVGTGGEISIVGMGGGSLAFGHGKVRWGVSATAPFGGTSQELREVIELARLGAVRTHVVTFALDEAPQAYELLDQGKINGRAVVRF